ncbi:hypothetical protein BpHYR1_051515 [Brachionus plicatilis]|uniref:Uncharacterized protein n=1 Tax=Brachionus plicatilis TaxID=10195 RepID=A0A3M7R9Q4_BRAPC|nr:hypothetical protein BpHYR1_051515 [Brachionus plicatilis]
MNKNFARTKGCLQKPARHSSIVPETHSLSRSSPNSAHQKKKKENYHHQQQQKQRFQNRTSPIEVKFNYELFALFTKKKIVCY